MIKKSYFQGTEAPKKNKPQYKPEPAEEVKSRFEDPFYKNYDLYETGKGGPGAGWHSMQNYKSIKDFLNAKRKRNKKKKKAFRLNLIKCLIKEAIDFKLDEYTDPLIGASNSDNPVGKANSIGGYLDKYLPNDDFEGKSSDKLNFGRDYEDNDIYLDFLINKYLNASEPGLLGSPSTIFPKEDEDSNFTISDNNPEYGTTNSGNTTYINM